MRFLLFCLFVSLLFGCGNVTPRHFILVEDEDSLAGTEQDLLDIGEDDLLFENEEKPDEDSLIVEDDPAQDDVEDPEAESDEDSLIDEGETTDDSLLEEQDFIPDEPEYDAVDADEPDEIATETDIMPEDDVIPDVDDAETLLEIEGDVMKDEGTATGHRLYSAKIVQFLGAKEMDDELRMWIAGDSYFTVTYDLGVGLNADIKTCVQCVIIGEDWNVPAAKFERTYLASSGTFVLTSSAGAKKMTLTDAKFREIEIAVDGSSTFIQDGIELTLFSPVSINLP